jgi:hypothetical protein
MKKKSELIWVEDVRATLVLPGRTKPIGRSSFLLQLKKHGFKAVQLPHGVTHRAYITPEQAEQLGKSFRLLHWRLFQGGEQK